MELKKNSKKRIGEILIESGFIQEKQLNKALELQKQKGGLIGGILIAMGAISEEDLVFALSKQFSIPFIRLSLYNVNRSAQKLIPRELVEQYNFFPFDQDEHTLSIAISDPLNQEAIEKIEKRVPYRLQVFVAILSDVREAISRYYGQTTPELTRG